MLAAAAAALTPPATLADFDASEGADLFAPWMLDSNGQAIQFPAEVVGFRVRYWPPGARGPGELVEDDDGEALFVPRNATPEEFRTLVGYKVGRYKLAALDQSFLFNPRLPLVVVSISSAMAARVIGRDATPAAAVRAAPSDDVVGQVLAFARESADQLRQANAQAFEQLANLHRESAESQRQTVAQVAESQRQTNEQLAIIVGAVSGVLSAAGSSGVVKKTLAIDAAAHGAPVTVQMMASNGNEAAPRNAAASSTAATAAAAAEKGTSMGDALVTLGLPVVEKFGSMLAYNAAKKLDMPEDYARSVSGLVQSTAQIAAKMMQPEPEAPPSGSTTTDAPASTVGLAARTGRELLAHVLEIQRALSEDDRAWVMQQMGARPGLIDALKPSVAAISVEEGARAVVALRAMDAALTTPSERAWFDRVLTPQMLPTVFRNLFIDAPIENAIACVREQAARGLPA